MLNRAQFNALPFLKSQLKPGETYEDLARLASLIEGILGAGNPIIPNASYGAEIVLAQTCQLSTIGAVTTETDLFTYTLPGGLLEVNDILEFDFGTDFTNSANNKTLKLYHGSQVCLTAVRTTVTNESRLWYMCVRGIASQLNPFAGYPSWLAATAVAFGTGVIDFSVDQVFKLTGTKASAGELLQLDYARLKLLKAPK